MTKLKDIFGQDAAVEAIRSACHCDRLPHGLIFSGRAGVGKATMAEALAALFLCEKPGLDDACGTCPSCRAMAAGAHPDYHVITKELIRLHDKSGASKATQLSIDVIRYEISAPAGRKTALGRGKVFVIEQAELMTAAAQNALLKTLEEPAGRTLIVLLSSHANELLATVRSRCQIIRFSALDEKWVKEELQRRGQDAATAAAAAEFADGSLGVALRWIEQGILAPAGAVAAAVEELFAGRGADLPDLLRKSAEAYAESVLATDELASKDSALRGGLAMYLSVAARRLDRRLTGATDAGQLQRACDAIDAVVRAEKYLDANVNVALVLEQLGLALRAPAEQR